MEQSFLGKIFGDSVIATEGEGLAIKAVLVGPAQFTESICIVSLCTRQNIGLIREPDVVQSRIETLHTWSGDLLAGILEINTHGGARFFNKNQCLVETSAVELRLQLETAVDAVEHETLE